MKLNKYMVYVLESLVILGLNLLLCIFLCAGSIKNIISFFWLLITVVNWPFELDINCDWIVETVAVNQIILAVLFITYVVSINLIIECLL